MGVVEGIWKHERSKVRLALGRDQFMGPKSWGTRFIENDKDNKLSRYLHVIASKLQGYFRRR